MFSKNRKDKKISCLLILSMMVSILLSACSQAEETTAVSDTTAASTTTAQETTDDTTAEDTDATDNVSQLANSSDDFPSWFESTNGELEGMDEYMVLRSETHQDQIITDIGTIEDEDVRNAAQSYSDEGYTLFDDGGVSYYGDREYGFCHGFSGQIISNGVLKNISVWKMNETLYNYFVLGINVYWNADEGALEDDGTCIRRYLENTYTSFGDEYHYYACYEFNRETGLMTCYEESDNPDNWSIFVVPEFEYDDPELEILAQNCLDEGLCIQRYGSPDVTSLEYDISLGFEAASEDMFIDIYYSDEDTFNAYFYEGRIVEWDTEDYEVEDDGTVIRYYNYEYGMVYEYDRDAGRVIELTCYDRNNRESLEDAMDIIYGN